MIGKVYKHLKGGKLYTVVGRFTQDSCLLKDNETAYLYVFTDGTGLLTKERCRTPDDNDIMIELHVMVQNSSGATGTVMWAIYRSHVHQHLLFARPMAEFIEKFELQEVAHAVADAQ